MKQLNEMISWLSPNGIIQPELIRPQSFLFAFCPCYSTFATYSATLSQIFFVFYACYRTQSFHNFLKEKNLFPHFLGSLSSLLCTLHDLGCPHAGRESWDQRNTCITNYMDRIDFTQMQTIYTCPDMTRSIVSVIHMRNVNLLNRKRSISYIL